MRKEKGIYGTFVIVSIALLNIFPTGENFFYLGIRTNLPLLRIFRLMIGRVFHRVASDSTPFEPCFSATTCMLLVLRTIGHVYIEIQPLGLSLHVTSPGESIQRVVRLSLEAILTLGWLVIS